MKREDVSRIFEGATSEQIDQILNLNSADIGKAKGGATQLQADLDAANAKLTAAQQTITTLEAAKGNADELQKQIDAYKAADAKRAQEAEAAKLRNALEERFTSAANGKTFIHDMVRRGVLEDFINEVTKPENAGKGDAAIFDAITKDKGFFASQNKLGSMGGINTDMHDDDSDKMTDAEYYASLYAKKG